MKKRRVWFPIVDKQKKMVMLDACYWSHRKNRVCSCFEDYSTGDSNTLALAIHKYLHETAFMPTIEFIATGALDKASGQIGKIGNAALKIKTALDSGKTYIFAPKSNRIECENCADIVNHPDFKNMIFWVDTWEEVKFLINKIRLVVFEQAVNKSNLNAENIIKKGIEIQIKDINTDLDILKKSINEMASEDSLPLWLQDLKNLQKKMNAIVNSIKL